MMDTYLVGGAVRDELLGREVVERDYLVVGATVEEMLAAGYLPVGRDFPVFLHPKTKEEYALARTEKKSGTGYQGFVFHTSPTLSIADDLARRDLTINAMAKNSKGQLIDLHGGKADLEARVLRHVSDAFTEDPVRILRLARFNARYHYLGFTVADETNALMYSMVRSGEVEALVAERVWQEMAKALMEPAPEVFFQVLRRCGALAIVLPELNALFGVPASRRWHGEVDSGIHSLMVLQRATALSTSLAVRFAALVHDLGKALTPIAKWPSHHGHDALGVKPIEQLCKRLKIPSAIKELATLVAQFHIQVHSLSQLKASTIVKLLAKLDVYRKPARFEEFLICCQADAEGRLATNAPYTQANTLRAYANACCSIDVQQVIKEGASGSAIQRALTTKRITAVNTLQQEQKANE